MTRFEKFQIDVANCKSPVELSALLAATHSAICITNHKEQRCDKRYCDKVSNNTPCLLGVQDYFESQEK